VLAAEWDVLALGAGEVLVGEDAASFRTLPVGFVVDAKDSETEGLEVVVGRLEELVVGRGVGVGLTDAAAA